MVGPDQEGRGELRIAFDQADAVVAERPGAGQQILGAEEREIVGQAVAERRREGERGRERVRGQQPVQRGDAGQQVARTAASGSSPATTSAAIVAHVRAVDRPGQVAAGCRSPGAAGRLARRRGRRSLEARRRGATRAGRVVGTSPEIQLRPPRDGVADLGREQAAVHGEGERGRRRLPRGRDGGLDVLGPQPAPAIRSAPSSRARAACRAGSGAGGRVRDEPGGHGARRQACADARSACRAARAAAR